jgi:hypothetical protein
MKYICVSILFAIVLSTTVYAEQVFSEKHLGIEFKYDEEVSIEFNPHAMRKIPIFLDSKYAGGLVVSVLPEGLSLEQLLDYGLSRYKSDYGTNAATLSKKKNKQGLDYYHYIVKYVVDNNLTTIEKAIFIKNRKSLLKKEGIETTYTINYKFIGEKAGLSLEKVVNSFNLIPNEPHYNDALFLSINKKPLTKK